MAIRVVEFSKGGTKLERFLPKNQHNQRKFLNFENWINGASEVFKNQSFKNPLFSSSQKKNKLKLKSRLNFNDNIVFYWQCQKFTSIYKKNLNKWALNQFWH